MKKIKSMRANHALKLSACVITKNEEKNLPCWLATMQQVADEMVVCDTGSTDKTVALAEAAGAKVVHFAWINDFAAAKNYALEQATGDWILFLDADEYFTDETLAILRRQMEKYNRDKRMGMVICRLINIDPTRNNTIIDTTLQARIFRNLPSIRFHGAVHEQAQNQGADLTVTCDNSLQIYHTGYAQAGALEKTKRNLPLILKRIEEAKTEDERNRLYPFLMDAYYGLGEYAKAIEYAHIAMDANVQLLGMELHFEEIIISSMQNLGSTAEELLEFLAKCIEKHPEAESFYLQQGILLWQLKRYDEAEVAMQQGLKLRAKFEQKLSTGAFLTDSSLRLLPISYFALGQIALQKEDKGSAAGYFLQGLKIQKHDARLLQGLFSCIGDGDNVELVELFNTLYTTAEDAGFVFETLRQTADSQLLLYYAKRATAQFQKQHEVEIYILAGRYDAARVAAAERLRRGSLQLTGAMLTQASGAEEIRAAAELVLPAEYKKCLAGERRTLTGKDVARYVRQLQAVKKPVGHM